MTAVVPADIDRATLAVVGDALIPRSPGRISASEAGIAGDLLDRIALLVPERLPLFRSVLIKAGQMGAEAALELMRRAEPAGYDLFCETVAAAYFMAPAVREQVGFPGRVPVPAKAEVADLEELLIPVLEAPFTPRGFDL